MESSKQRKENEEAERLARQNERRQRQRLEETAEEDCEERLIWGKYREAPTIDYGVKHKASLYIYTCALMLYKGRRSQSIDCLNSRVSLCFVNARLSSYY